MRTLFSAPFCIFYKSLLVNVLCQVIWVTAKLKCLKKGKKKSLKVFQHRAWIVQICSLSRWLAYSEHLRVLLVVCDVSGLTGPDLNVPPAAGTSYAVQTHPCKQKRN